MSKRSALGRLGAKGGAAAVGLAKSLGDPKKTKRLLSVGKLVVPAVAPFALKAAGSARHLLDERRANRLGVDVDHVAEYRGPTGRTKARIHSVAQAVKDLRSRRAGDRDALAFAERTEATLADLVSATRAAGPMPAARRRPTLAAVDRELEQIEAALIGQLVRSRA